MTTQSYLSFSVTTTLLLLPSSISAVLINEVADQGTADVCNGNDWIELFLPIEDEPRSIWPDSSFMTTMDRMMQTPISLLLQPRLNPGEYLLLCTKTTDGPQFGIGGSDTVTLLDPSGTLVSTTGPLQDRGVSGVSFAYDDTSQTYVYTSTPTPGSENIIVPLPEPETVEQTRARLVAQNDMGIDFFNMDMDGLPVEGGYDEVVDLNINMDPQLWQQMYDERSYEVYTNFDNATISSMNGTVLVNLTSPGRIRPKGQSTLVFGTCMDRSIPYSIDWDHVDSNQTLFGVERSYLRTHFGDWSFVREWSMHRMLARFGLPHLRTRTVRFFVNDEPVGLYELLEAPDQDYVFQRSFPDFDPTNYAFPFCHSSKQGLWRFKSSWMLWMPERFLALLTTFVLMKFVSTGKLKVLAKVFVPRIVPMKAAIGQNFQFPAFAKKIPDFVSMAYWIASVKVFTARMGTMELKGLKVQTSLPFVGSIQLLAHSD